MKDYDSFNAIFGKKLSVCMAEAEMTPSELSESSGVSIESIRDYLRKDSAPLFVTVCKLAEALGCTPNDLCGWEEQR